MQTANIVFPHQLFEDTDWLTKDGPVYLVEEHLFYRQFNFHKLKLVFHRASMQSYAVYLGGKGFEVKYIDSVSPHSDIRDLVSHLSVEGFKKINCINPTDNWLEQRIRNSCAEKGLQVYENENPLFLNSRADLESFFRIDKKSFFQTTFYKQQRIKQQVLITPANEPVGGKWSFDAENRKPYPKNQTPPAVQLPVANAIWKDALTYVETHFPGNPGEVSKDLVYPFDFKMTQQWLEAFFQFRFHDFGTYEDAIVKDASILHHSVLTPMLNVGLITPQEIVDHAIYFAETNQIPINSLEGFVRQIIGWREFIRGMYEVKGSFSRTRNFWGFKRKIPESFYNGTTGIEPVDVTITKVLKTGYCHHIERLMVLGNFMLLCEFDPDEVYTWFMELFIDAYDWVMVPNVYGMSQFADGGLFATKPYISGSNYIMKMSNYQKGDWQKTWDGLFWRFMDLHREFFLKNPRLSMLVRSFDRMSTEKKRQHFTHAEDFFKATGQVCKTDIGQSLKITFNYLCFCLDLLPEILAISYFYKLNNAIFPMRKLTLFTIVFIHVFWPEQFAGFCPENGTRIGYHFYYRKGYR